MKLYEKIKGNFQKLRINRNVVFGIFGLLLIFSAYHAYFANRIIPGVTVGKFRLGGKTTEQSLAIIREPLLKERSLTLIDEEEDTNYEIKSSDIQLTYNPEETIKKAFEVGRTGKFLLDSKTKLAGLVKTLPLRASTEFSSDLLSQRLGEVKGMVNRSPQNASFYLDEDENLRIKKDETGRKVNSSDLYKIVIQSIDNLDYSAKSLPIKDEKAELLVQDLEGLKGEARKLLEKDLTVVYANNAWEVTPEDKLNYLTVVKEKDGVDFTLNKKTFEAYVERLEKEVNVLPRGKVTEEDSNGQVLSFEITEKGEEIDVKDFTSNFKEALYNNKDTVAITTQPTDNSSDLTKYGIFALLGRGESDYTGSIPSRIHNLNLAADRAGGVLVPPGEVYSLNESVGPINASTGYNAAWVIANGRTVLGSGGGVCQTSTTMFRAALNSGLPVVERHPHAYRVYYYENDKPLGFDASIYQPALDFRFRNDTPNYILVQTEKIPEENKLAFRIYGTPDGRKVEITEPEIYGVSPAPAPKYQETDTLPKGVTRQIDFAAPGGTSVFSRTVTKDGEVLFEETYKSVYRPWQAIYLVGTKTN